MTTPPEMMPVGNICCRPLIVSPNGKTSTENKRQENG
jgi:hypothetical protein